MASQLRRTLHRSVRYSAKHVAPTELNHSFIQNKATNMSHQRCFVKSSLRVSQ